MMVLTIYQTSKVASLKEEIESIKFSISDLLDSQRQQYKMLRNEILEELKSSNSFVSDFKFNYGTFKDTGVVVNFQLIPKEVRDGEYFRVELWSENDEYPIIVILEKIGSYRYMGSITVPMDKDYKIKVLSIYNDNITIHEVRESILPQETFSYSFWGSNLGSITWKPKQITSNRQYLVNYLPEKMNGNKTSISDVILHLEKNGKVIQTYPMIRIGSDMDDTFSYIFQDYRMPIEPLDEIIIYATAKDSRGFNYKWIYEHFKLDSEGIMEDIPNVNMSKTIIY